MLDKGQIKDWDGEPEAAVTPAVKDVAPDMRRAFFDAREALPTGERVTLTPEQSFARRRRGQWLALALFAFVILVFVLTMTKVGGNVVSQ